MIKKELIPLAMTLFTLCLLAQAPEKLAYRDSGRGTSQILRVPLAKYVNSANGFTGPINETDSVFTSSSTNERIDNYLKLKKLGYAERAIFEDLGNVNFLSENYWTAVFWYKKLITISKDGTLTKSYHKRYQYALEKMNTTTVSSSLADQDWLSEIKADYNVKKESSKHLQTSSGVGLNRGVGSQLQNEQFIKRQLPAGFGKYASTVEKLDTLSNYSASITITADGNTAFFSKAIKMKPLHGIFSKKELVHKIYRADKIGNQWKNIQEMALCPKYSSALHPTVSADGKHLFFASDMPGTLGKYDIYVSTIQNNGTLGIAKNLGEKVNTKKNDLYPSIVGGNTLFFASEGRKGHGGLDVYMVQVDQRKVGLAVNLGSPINSAEDDFSVRFKTKDRMGYVMSNRGKNKGNIHQVAFSYGNKRTNRAADKREYEILEFLNSDLKGDYSSSVFEDE